MRELWDDRGIVEARRGRDLGFDDVREVLRRGPVRFVVATVGHRPHWVPEAGCMDFWRTEVQTHMACSEGARLDEFPNGYGYFASEWLPIAGSPIIVLEAQH